MLAATATAPSSPTTLTGLVRSLVVPSPSCPLGLAPQPQTVPLSLTARQWKPPAAMETTWVKWPLGSVGSMTGVGVVLPHTPLLAVQTVPLPSWPESLAPHAHTVPSDFRASVIS